jgi:signal transduction histidine kinase/DNA-binding response OmpR family regulator
MSTQFGKDDGASLSIAQGADDGFMDRLQRSLMGQDADIAFDDMKAIMDVMHMGVILLDNHLNILFMNKTSFTMWNCNAPTLRSGLSFKTLMEANKHILNDFQSWKTFITMGLNDIKNGDIPPHEIERKDGVTLIYSCRSLSNGRRLLSYFDITPQKNAEKKFQEAEQKAVLADRAKSEFLANMSHEIRTPMNGVLGMAELLARTNLDQKQQTFTEIIVKSGNALLTIINDILDFSKIDAGQLTLDPSPFRLCDAIEDVATLVSARAQEKEIELIVRIQPNLPEYVMGDVGRIRQIVTNLMGNAVKFTERGHVVVEVSGKVNPISNIASLMFSISDTGIGVPAEKLSSIFEKFNQIDASSTRRHEGTGLGLAIATKLVALMGGEVGATSTVGQGSRFWFSVNLPVDEVESKKPVLPLDVEGSRILIIDDNPINRSILIEQMSSWNFDSCAAQNGDEGLAVLEQAHYFGLVVDLIILDYQMPKLNGADVAKMIRQNPNLSHLPIILLTSVDTAMQSPEFEGVEIQGHLMKPARSTVLFNTIVQLIREARCSENAKKLYDKARLLNQNEISNTITPPVSKMFEPHHEEVAHSNQGLDILVAEDNAVNQIVFTQILENLPYHFEIVENGLLALQAMKSKNPTIILMDVSMPEMNGLQASTLIRAYERDNNQKRTPIIGVTAHALKGDRERCLASGMDDYICKPISPDMLSAKVLQYMSEATGIAQSA